ncbi:unnamed protein product [Plutella xylostella]|uniref:(diamondback moth) hypothetical protein n=1 Tax=Plutella xylostella TaxID=51655 RepID=A0A8S4F3Q9_PLUXY|nr:unnamed protein product [Plutella xylostella]
MLMMAPPQAAAAAAGSATASCTRCARSGLLGTFDLTTADHSWRRTGTREPTTTTRGCSGPGWAGRWPQGAGLLGAWPPGAGLLGAGQTARGPRCGPPAPPLSRYRTAPPNYHMTWLELLCVY